MGISVLGSYLGFCFLREGSGVAALLIGRYFAEIFP